MSNYESKEIKLNNYLATDKKWFDFYELQELMLTNSEKVVFENSNDSFYSYS